MAINVKFLKGTQAEYNALGSSKDPNTFYYLTDTSQLFLGTVKLSNANEVNAAMAEIGANKASIAEINNILNDLTTGGTGSIAGMIKDAIDPIKASIGNLSDLDTAEKGTVVGAVNELQKDINTVQTNSIVTVTPSTTNAQFAKQYTIVQNNKTIGVIDIPKDLVVTSGSVVTNPAGQPAGTYIELVLANSNNSKIYVNVGTLIDIYTAAQNATEVQIVVNEREISATIVNGSVNTAKLANSAVTTVKIADKNVTKAKLADTVQASLNKADSAVQTVTPGTNLGTIAVDGKDVKVTGLGTAAYQDYGTITSAIGEVQTDLNGYKSSNDTKVNKLIADVNAITDDTNGILNSAKQYADTRDNVILANAKAYADGLAPNYATADQGTKADSALQVPDINEGTTIGAFVVRNKTVKVHGLKSAAYTESTAYDPAGTGAAEASSALSQAKAYVDAALTWETIQ